MMVWTNGTWMGGGWVFMVFVWVMLAVGVFVVLRVAGSGAGPAAAAGRESALDILNRRYASGEIDRAEYEQKRHDIEGR